MPVESDAEGLGEGAGIVVDDGAWVLIEGTAERRLGAALAWAVRRGATSLHVVADEGGGTVARRSQGFALDIHVWFPEGRTLLPVLADDPVSSPAPNADHLALTAMIEEAGAAAHVEFGVVTGEVRGLEVCRVVDEPTRGNFAELSDVVIEPPADLDDRLAEREHDGVILEVGVGANDREAFQLIHGHIPTPEALAGVVAAVAEHRQVASRQHPLNRMAPERFVRWQVEQEPDRLGLTNLVAAEPPVRRQSMKHTEACVGLGTDTGGEPVVVVFSAGVDLDLMAFVADVRLSHTERMIVAMPERDLVSITRDLAEQLASPIELVGLTAD